VGSANHELLELILQLLKIEKRSHAGVSSII